MNTITAWIELLVIGIQASIWIGLFLLGMTGHRWILGFLPNLQPWAMLVSTAVFTWWITLGIVVDRMATYLYGFYNPKDLLLKIRWIQRKAHHLTSDPRMTILAQQTDKGVSTFLESIRSRARILR